MPIPLSYLASGPGRLAISANTRSLRPRPEVNAGGLRAIKAGCHVADPSYEP